MLAAGYPVGATHPVREDLDAVGKNLEQEKVLLQRLRKKSSSLLQTLSEIEKRLETAQAELQAAEIELEECEKRRQDMFDKRRQALAGLAAGKKRISVRLRAMYKAGEIGWLNFLFEVGSFKAVLDRFGYLQWMVRRDKLLVEQNARSHLRLTQLEHSLEEQHVRLRARKEQVLKSREQAESAKAEQLKAIELVRREAGLHRKAVAELHKARGRLMQLVSMLEGKDSVNLGFASWRKRLEPPVKKARIDVPFGLQVDERFKTKTLQQGVDILAKEGSPVVSVYPGKVVYTKPFQGYGLLVIVDHGGGYYTLYAHLGTFLVKEGDRLRAGQPVGTLGRSGSLKGPYLYFEVREKGKAVDPEQWVRFD